MSIGSGVSDLRSSTMYSYILAALLHQVQLSSKLNVSRMYNCNDIAYQYTERKGIIGLHRLLTPNRMHIELA